MSRRDQILDEAARLFAARGFTGVSIAEIGSACGISGPALYKHFPGKESILAEMLVSISETLLRRGQELVAAHTDPERTLEALADWHTEFAVTHPDLIVVQSRDWAWLPTEAREHVRGLQRRYLALWAEQLRALDATLDEPASQAKAHALFGLLNSTPHSSLLPADQMRSMLATMALLAAGPANQPAR